ncbi:MAG: ATP-binding protein [Anaerolineae bacterium]|nr:ATP-binding protein [Anaerolineae bacterium]NUQ06712.1 PAS domain S-box protein [Anaerolineae bacterium]
MSPLEAAYAVLRQNPLWRQMFELNPAIQLIIDPVSRVVIDANPAACRFYRYRREEFKSLLFDHIEVNALPEGDLGSESMTFSFQHRIRGGELRDVKVNASAYDFDGETLTHMILVDITKRRRAEAAEQDQRALSAALATTTAALNSSLDLHEVLDRILEQVQHLIPCDFINIMLIENDYAAVVRSRGYEQTVNIEEYLGVKLNIHSTPTLRWMIENNRSLLIADIATDPRWRQLHTTEDWLKSYLGIPIRMGSHVIGFLNLDGSAPMAAVDYDERVLQAFADQAGVAIRNARLYERVQRQAMLMEQRVAERTAELEYERRQLRAILDSMTEGVIYSEPDSNGLLQPRYLNRAMARLLGQEHQEDLYSLIARIDALAIEGSDQPSVRSVISAALDQQPVVSMQLSLVGPDGARVEASLTTTRVDSLSGELLGAVTVVRDISREIALERQRSRFVAQASHELRTPLANMKTRLYLLRRQPERIDTHLPVLEKATSHMWRLVENLLDISRLERGAVRLDLEQLEVQEVVAFVVEAHRPAVEIKGQRLHVDLPDEPLVLIADGDRLIQVLNNLVANASAYTPAGGIITVRALRVPEMDAGESPPAGVRIDVIDTGIGIPPDRREEIFQPFYRIADDNDGSGLGLSITREIIHLHGGTIQVGGMPEGGSCFTLWLPLRQDAAGGADAPR